MMNVQISLATTNAPRTKRFEALIDSGASRCMFHAGFAVFLGIDLESGIREITNGIGGKEDVWLHDIFLYVPAVR